MSGPRGVADDLKKLTGVSPTIEKQLNDLGIFHFWQIAELSPTAAHKIGEEVGLPGRVEGWIAKAKELTARKLKNGRRRRSAARVTRRLNPRRPDRDLSRRHYFEFSDVHSGFARPALPERKCDKDRRNGRISALPWSRSFVTRPAPA